MRAPARHHTPDAPDGIAVWRVALGGLLVIAAVTTATFWLVPVAGLLALGRRCWLWRWELLTVTVAVFLIGYGLSAMGLPMSRSNLACSRGAACSRLYIRVRACVR